MYSGVTIKSDFSAAPGAAAFEAATCLFGSTSCAKERETQTIVDKSPAHNLGAFNLSMLTTS
jgi:hypothetical protein